MAIVKSTINAYCLTRNHACRQCLARTLTQWGYDAEAYDGQAVAAMKRRQERTARATNLAKFRARNLAAYHRAFAANPTKYRMRNNAQKKAKRAAQGRARQKLTPEELRTRRNARQRIYHRTHASEAQAYRATRRLHQPVIVRKQEQARKQRRRARRAGAPINDLTAAQWREIQAAYEHRCVYCGKRAKGHLTQDHLTPLSKGGSHTVANVIPACRGCNSKKYVGPPLTPVQPLLLTSAPARRVS